mgnify:CR=1 FL=1
MVNPNPIAREHSVAYPYNMSIFDDMRSVWDTGLKGSKKAFDSAKEQVRRLGDESVTSLDIRQLRTEREKVLQELGRIVYDSFATEDRKSVTPKTPGARELIEELKQTDAAIAEKEAALSALKNERSRDSDTDEKDSL